MALNQRLDLRQGQSLVMTPQLQQAIKLLQMSNIELQAFVDQELERNPLLERDERTELQKPEPQPSEAQPDAEAGQAGEYRLQDNASSAGVQYTLEHAGASGGLGDGGPMPDLRYSNEAHAVVSPVPRWPRPCMSARGPAVLAAVAALPPLEP